MMSIPNLTISTQNVSSFGQGTDGVWKRYPFRDHFKHLQPQPDLILLQEHKFSAKDCEMKTSQLDYIVGPPFWNEAIYNPIKGRLKGGRAILFSRRLTPLVLQSRIIVPGRAEFVTLQLNFRLIMNLMYIYEPYKSPQRTKIWKTIDNASLPQAHWVLAGDFNNIESLQDKVGGKLVTGMRKGE